MKKMLCKKIKNNKAITLIALVITIVVLIILAAVAINLTLGENGLFNRAKQAALEHKKAQYYEEINIEIIEEQMERQTSPSDTPFIVSLNNRLAGTSQASNESVNARTRKSWVKSTIMCDAHMNENRDDLSQNTVLIIETTEDYEIFVHVNNSACTATIDESSFGKAEDPCAIHFNLNGGSGSISDTSIRKNFTVSMPNAIPTRTNYTFGGWCQNQDGSTKIYSAGSASDPITEETTFYAIWTLNAVTLSFDSNGGSGTMNPVPIIINTPTAISEMTFTAPTGYIFDKWTTNADGTGDSYNDLAEITISTDTTLYAQWKRQYNVAIDLGNGLSISNSNIKIKQGENYQANITTNDSVRLAILKVTMGNQAIDTNINNGTISIQNVNNDISIIARSISNTNEVYNSSSGSVVDNTNPSNGSTAFSGGAWGSFPHNTLTAGQYITYEFPNSEYIYKFQFTVGAGATQAQVGADSVNITFTLKGSKDGNTFVPLMDNTTTVAYAIGVTGETTKIFDIDCNDDYKYYRLELISGGYNNMLSVNNHLNVGFSNIRLYKCE